MDKHQFATTSRSLASMPSRRHLLRGLAAAGLGWGSAHLPHGAAAKKKKKKDKPRTRKGLCGRNGSKCRRPGKNCKKTYCLRALFTIEALWTGISDQDTVLSVPQENATTGPFPFIHHGCNPDDGCVEAYPFACVSRDAQGRGDEITTINELLPGTYEYWIEIHNTTPAGELTIVLKDSGGRVVRQWANPANPLDKQGEWHVFDIAGRLGRVTSIDELIDEALQDGAHYPNTNVCPD